MYNQNKITAESSHQIFTSLSLILTRSWVSGLSSSDSQTFSIKSSRSLEIMEEASYSANIIFYEEESEFQKQYPRELQYFRQFCTLGLEWKKDNVCSGFLFSTVFVWFSIAVFSRLIFYIVEDGDRWLYL